MMILGIEDPWIWGVYLGIILSTLLCVVISWNYLIHTFMCCLWYYELE